MRTKEESWFETAVKYDKVMDNGMQKKVNETYVVCALTCGEAEEKVLKEISQYISGEADVKSAKSAPYTTVMFTDNERDDRWYKVKVAFVIVRDSGEEKKNSVTYLVQGSSVESALKNIKASMNGTMLDYYIQNIDETKILDVFE